MKMNEILAPCNSIVDLESLHDASQSSTTYSTPCTLGSKKRKSRLSETDFSIIEKTMTLERKKTLMCTEQSNFQVLHKMKTKKLPVKKYNSVAISEYEKFILKELNIGLKNSDEVKYKYPETVQGVSIKSPGKAEVIRVNGKKTKVCVLF